ncbi:hypothetical protein OIU79_003277 [Salix purpurea]|uniref:Uncharacterized protein n=1 Tax=Salix purpurea TaxID=77065 RepID=A0A9Q0ULH0_SALPP|nr:hypothetical protein OIU79_003277 [Salix purpurea]
MKQKQGCSSFTFICDFTIAVILTPASAILFRIKE